MTDTIDWRARINLARALLNHREPSEHVAGLAVMALDGASIDEVVIADQHLTPEMARSYERLVAEGLPWETSRR